MHSISQIHVLKDTQRMHAFKFLAVFQGYLNLSHLSTCAASDHSRTTALGHITAIIWTFVLRDQTLLVQVTAGEWYDSTDSNRYRRRKHVTQFHDLIGFSLGRFFFVLAELLVAVSLLGTGIAQIVASSSSQYTIDKSHNKLWASFLQTPVCLVLYLIALQRTQLGTDCLLYQNRLSTTALASHVTTYTSQLQGLQASLIAALRPWNCAWRRDNLQQVNEIFICPLKPLLSFLLRLEPYICWCCRVWGLILGPPILVIALLPGFRSVRIINIIALVGTNYSRLYMFIYACHKGITPGIFTR